MNKKRVVIVALTCILILGTAANVFAYNLMPDGYYKQTVVLTHLRSVYPSELVSARDSWNNANVGRTITSGTKANQVYLVNKAGTMYGEYIPDQYNNPVNNGCKSFKIELNDKMMPKLNSKGKQSVIAHEIGHALGLNENNGSGALMDQTRDRSTVYTPQRDDINGAKAQARASGWL